jgi:hypothetical protein
VTLSNIAKLGPKRFVLAVSMVVVACQEQPDWLDILIYNVAVVNDT